MLNFEDWFYENEDRFFWIHDLDNLSKRDEEFLTALYLRYMKDFNTGEGAI